ncbi:MAG: hypothetical protein RLZZ628_1274 [Bacteroidota bacterium]
MHRHWEVMERTGTKHFGFIPDMGGFTKRLARVQVERMIRQGADPKIAEFVCAQHEKGVMAEYTIFEVSRMSNRRIDMALAELSRHNTMVNPISLLEHIRYTELTQSGTFSISQSASCFTVSPTRNSLGGLNTPQALTAV